jgi:hypothetical protein
MIEGDRQGGKRVNYQRIFLEHNHETKKKFEEITVCKMGKEKSQHNTLPLPSGCKENQQI